MKAAVAEAMGGCLFLDEAYALVGADGSSSGGVISTDSYSREAIRTLLTELENKRTGFMCAMAGYADKMDILMRQDPGLDQRFKMRLHLPDYSPDQIARIAALVADKRFSKTLEGGLEQRLAKYIGDFHWRDMAKQNGGLGVNLVESAIDRQADRLAAMPDFGSLSVGEIKGKARVLVAADFDISGTAADNNGLGDPALQGQVDAEIDALVGMQCVKDYFQDMRVKVQYVN